MTNSDTTAPAWFVKFYEDIQDHFLKSMQLFDKLTMRISALENLEEKVKAEVRAEFKAELDEIRRDVDRLIAQRPIVSSTPATVEPALIDECEIKVSGIPIDCTYTEDEAVDVLAANIGLKSVKHHIVEIRPWHGPETENPTASTKPSFVCKLSSPVIRDSIVKHSRKLKNKSVHGIFGCDSDVPVSISPLWPRNTYVLLRKAQEAANKYDFRKPFIRGLRVCIRYSPTSPEVIIHSEEELRSFIQRHSTSQLLPT